VFAPQRERGGDDVRLVGFDELKSLGGEGARRGGDLMILKRRADTFVGSRFDKACTVSASAPISRMAVR